MAETSNPKVSPGIPFEADGEVIYLSPNSAEGKAVQRIEAMEAGEEVEWITVFDPETDTLDEAALDAWLTERGYPVVQIQIHPLVSTEDLPALPAQLQTDFSRYKLVLVKNPQKPLRIPSHDLEGRLANYRALDIEWEGNPNAYRLVYQIYEKPAPRRVFIISFDEHDSAYEKAKARINRRR